MTFASFRDAEVQKAIRRLASADRLAVFVGAGISAEAGLPSWSELVERLLTRASSHSGHFGTEEQRREWVQSTLRSEQPIAVAGIAQTLLGKDLTSTLGRELYKPRLNDEPRSPAEFAPGPTAHAIASLRVAWDESGRNLPRMKILTTNYDDFLEEAFKASPEVSGRDVLSIYWPMRPLSKKNRPIKIHHLHGFIPRRGRPKGDVILTDRSFYSQGEPAAARDAEVKQILCHSTCLFLGTSFSDPNIIKYIEESARLRRAQQGAHPDYVNAKPETPVHVALLTRHSSDPSPFQEVEEDIAKSRLGSALTTPIFLDHYADVAQFVYEVRNRFVAPDHVSHYRRASELLRRLLVHVIFTTRRRAYDGAQASLNKRFSALCRAAYREVDSKLGSSFAKEPIAAALWLMDPAGETMTPWITTDRIHRDPIMLQTEKISPGSRWLAVRTVCEGRFMAEPRTNVRSRWSYLAGVPLLVDDSQKGRLPIGAITMATLVEAPDTNFYGLSEEGRTLLREALNDAVGEWLLESAQDAKTPA